MIYVDYNGTTPVAEEVQEAINSSLREDWGNPSTTHELGQKARTAIEKARGQVANLVNGKPSEIIFTSGGTESNNMVIFGLCQNKRSSAHVITTNVEHDSVSLPLKHLQETKGLEVTEVDVSDYDKMADNVIAAIKDNTVLITVMTANNETGVIFPIKEIGERLTDVRKKRAALGLIPIVFHSDAAQILGKEAVDVNALQVDCLTIVGHKFYGPRIGALWTRVAIPPLLFGGGNPNRPGTENTPMIVGLGAAADLAVGELKTRMDRMEMARNSLEDHLKDIAHANCASLPRLVNTSSLSFHIKPSTGRDLLSNCRRVLAGVGAACHAKTSSGDLPKPSRILLNSGVPADDAGTSVRLSFGCDASKQLVADIVEDLRQAYFRVLPKGPL